jgi:hypothetical protein
MTKDEIFTKEMRIAEEIYGTETDPDQMPITLETAHKLEGLFSGWLETEFDEAGQPISWAVLMPTQRTLAEEFLRGAITEKELLEKTQPQEIYDALYIVSIITVPEHRGKNLSLKVLERAIARAPLTADALYFTWPTTPEGKGAIKKYAASFEREIKMRE